MNAERLVAAVALAATMGSGAACSAMYGPTTPDRNWNMHETPRFSLYVRPGSFCESAAMVLGEVLEDQYTHATRALGLATEGRVSVFLYNSGAEVHPPLPSERSGVAFPDTQAVHAVCVSPVDDNLKSLLTHEANHVIVQNGLGRAGTSFMNEGLASALTSERFGKIGPTFLYEWTARNRARLPRLADLIDDGKWSSSSDIGYKTSASFLAFLLERHGPVALRQLYYARSADFAQRATEVYSSSLEQLETDWLLFIASRND